MQLQDLLEMVDGLNLLSTDADLNITDDGNPVVTVNNVEFTIVDVGSTDVGSTFKFNIVGVDNGWTFTMYGFRSYEEALLYILEA